MMREAVSLMGGYGVTEDCPGFLGQKWMDAQLEATYEGPEAVQRLQLSITMTNELFLAQFQQWIPEMRRIASDRPGTGACTLATAMQLWLWTLNHVQTATDADGAKLYHKTRQGVTFPLADALCWLLAARQFILDVIELETKGAANPALADGLAGTVAFLHRPLPRAKPPAPPAKSAASAPRLFTATTAIRPGTKPAATPAIAPRNWNRSKASSPASTARPAPMPMFRKPARRIRSKPARA